MKPCKKNEILVYLFLLHDYGTVFTCGGTYFIPKYTGKVLQCAKVITLGEFFPPESPFENNVYRIIISPENSITTALYVCYVLQRCFPVFKERFPGKYQLNTSPFRKGQHTLRCYGIICSLTAITVVLYFYFVNNALYFSF